LADHVTENAVPSGDSEEGVDLPPLGSTIVNESSGQKLIVLATPSLPVDVAMQSPK
jgi:hypothetical protein